MNAFARTLATLGLGVALGAGGSALWGHDGHAMKGGVVKPLAAYDLDQKLGDVEAKATVVEVTFEPGVGSPAHRHPGPVIGYVIEGEYEHALDDGPVKRLEAGDTFYEASGVLHRVSRNPQESGRARVLAVVLHPRDEKELAKPAANAPR